MRKPLISIPPYVRLPSETGKGIEFGKIPSRIKVAEDIKTFLSNAKKQENQPLVLFLIGEWGEGKTTLYDRYLKSREVQEEVGGIYVMDIQTDILVKYAKQIFKKEIFPVDNIDPGYRLLAALFLTLRNDHAEELKELLGEPLPGERSYDSLREYVNRCLRLIKKVAVKNDGITPLVIFIDEFETFALIQEDEILKEFIIEGLTKIINGKIDSMFENKISILHLIFSITPPAFARLHAVAGAIGGRFLQRVKSIYLHPLSKEERAQFINELLSYMWNNPKMDVNSVFLPPSVLNPIIHSTIGNTRALQQAITLLLGKKLSKNGTPIEYKDVIEFLNYNEIVVAGANVTLINNQTLKSIYSEIEKLEDKGENSQEIKDVFEFIISTFGTIPITEISQYFRDGTFDKLKIKYYLEQLNKIFRRSKPLGASLGTNSFVYKGKKYKIMDYEAFSNMMISIVYKILEDSNVLMSTKDSSIKEDVFVRQFLDNFMWIDESGNISMFWPQVDPDRPNQHIQYLTETLKIGDEAEIEDIYKAISDALSELVKRGKISEAEGYYILSPALINSLYFSPELIHIDFISEKNIRFKVWRHAQHGADPKYLFNGVLALMVQSGFNIEKVISTSPSSQSGAGTHVVALKSWVKYNNKITLPVHIVFSVTTANLTEDQVEETVKMLRKLNRKKGIIPQVVVFIYQGEMLESARSKIIELPREYLSAPLFINIPTSIDKLQLISLGLILHELGAETPNDINDKLLKIIQGDLSEEEKEILNIPKLMTIRDTLRSSLRLGSNRIIEVLENSNILIRPIIRTLGKRSHALPEKSLKAGLKYFLVVPEAHENGISPDRALMYSDYAIRRWYFFSQKGGLLGEDIESERELEQRAELLARNRYLDRISTGNYTKYKINPITPIEDRILQFIKKYGNHEGVSRALIENYFIEEQEGTLNFILDVMKEKGLILIHQEGSFSKIIPVNKDIISEEYQKAVKTLQDIKVSELDTIQVVGYFCDSKERGMRVKHLSTFIEEIERIMEKAEEYLNSSTSIESLSKAMVFTKLAHDLLSLYDDIKTRKGQIKYRTLISESERHLQLILTGYKNALETSLEAQTHLQEKLNSIVVKDPIKIELEEISKVRELYSALRQIYQEKYDLRTYEALLESLWSSLVLSKHDKNKSFPFYYNKKLAEELKFNYKIYKMYEEMAVTLLNRHAPIGSEELEEILNQADKTYMILLPKIESKLSAIIHEIDTILDQSVGLTKRARELREKLSKVDELKYLSEYIPDIKSLKVPAYSTKITSIKDIEEIVSYWRKQIKVDAFIMLMDQLETIINKIIESKKSVHNNRESISMHLKGILQSLNDTIILKSVVKDEIEFLEQMLDRRELLEDPLSTLQSPRELQRELSTTVFMNHSEMLNAILGHLERYHEEIISIERKYVNIRAELKQHIDNINSTIKKILIEPTLKTSKNLASALDNLVKIDPLNETGKACDKARIKEDSKTIIEGVKYIQENISLALNTNDYKQVEQYIKMLNDYIEQLQTLIQCYLTKEEQEVFLEYLRIKNNTHTRVTLKEFIETASKNLGKDIKDTFFELVEKDIIVLYI